MAIPGTPKENSSYRFGSFELDAITGELRKFGYRIALQDQPARILTLLLNSPGELVTRDRIREALWSAETFVDFDRGLNKAMVKLRQALDDDADAPRYIETLPKRGYRFLLPVEIGPSLAIVSENPAIEKSPAVSEPENAASTAGFEGVTAASAVAAGTATDKTIFVPAKRSTSRRVTNWATRVLAAIACVGIVFWLMPAKWRDETLPMRLHPPIRSLAVLPLQNLSGDPAEDYFADGMTDELTTSLANIHSLRVISRTTMNQYRAKHMTVPEIARELHVDAVIEGSVVRSGDKVRITTQLIDARRDQHLWAQSYERNLTDILEVQDEIAFDIESQVQKKVDSGKRDITTVFAKSRVTIRPDAYDDYLRGRSELTKQNPMAMKKAIEYFQAAIEDDPQYPQAYAGLADAYSLMANYQALPAAEAFPRARAASLKALGLDPDSAEAHAALALVKHHFDWDWAGAEQEYQRAIQLQPNYVVAHQRYAWFLTDVGRHDEAISELHRAQELDPQSIVVATNLGRSLYHARRFEEATDQLKKAVEMDPNRIFSHIFLGMVYDARQMCAEALNEIRTVQGLNGGLDTTGAVHAYVTCGRADDARKALGILAGPSTDPVQDWTFVAGAYASLGETDRAFEWLQRAFDHHDFFLTEIKTGPYFDPLRADPRFQKLLARMKFPT